MTTALETSAKRSYVLVSFQFGSPAQAVGFTNWTIDVTDSGINHEALPAMEIRVPKNTGTFKEGKASIRLPLNSFTDPLSKGEPAAPVLVVITEVTVAAEGAVAAERLTLFKGKLIKATRNTRARNDQVTLIFETIKESLVGAAGIPANHHCSFFFTGAGCQFNAAAFIKTGTVDSITQRSAVLSGVVTPAPPGGSFADDFWKKGYLELDGVRVMIRDWSSFDPTVFILKRRPPASWVGETVIVYPGCSKEVEVCRGRWDNEEHFGGFGFGIPAYLPTIETQ